MIRKMKAAFKFIFCFFWMEVILVGSSWLIYEQVEKINLERDTSSLALQCNENVSLTCDTKGIIMPFRP